MNKHTPVETVESILDRKDEERASPTRALLEASTRDAIVEDVSRIIQSAPFIARYPARLFDAGLIDEFASAVDILACKVADLKEAQGADR